MKSRSRVQSTGPPVLQAASAGRERRVCRRIALYNTKSIPALPGKLSRPTPRERYCSLCRYLRYITCIDGYLLATSVRLYFIISQPLTPSNMLIWINTTRLLQLILRAGGDVLESAERQYTESDWKSHVAGRCCNECASYCWGLEQPPSRHWGGGWQYLIVMVSTSALGILRRI